MILGPRMAPFFSLIWDTCVAGPASCLVVTVTLLHQWVTLFGGKQSQESLEVKAAVVCSSLFMGLPHPFHLCSECTYSVMQQFIRSVPQSPESCHCNFMHVLIHPTKGMCSPPWSPQRKTLRGQAHQIFVASRSRALWQVCVLGLAHTGDTFAVISQSGQGKSASPFP